MNIDQLKAFVQVVQTGNFTKSSEILLIPQPTLSSRIQQLELEIGFELLNRDKKNTSVTIAGSHFYKFALNTLNSLAQTQLALMDLNKEQNITLKFGVPHSYGYVMAALTSYLFKKIPHIKFSYVHAVSDASMIALKNRTLDIAITFHKKIDHDLVFEKIDHQDIKLIVSPLHWMAELKEIDLLSIASERLILYKTNTMMRNWIDDTFRHYKISYNSAIESDNNQMIIELILQNLGVGLMPERLVNKEIENNELSSIPIQSNPFHSFEAFLVYNSSEGYLSDILTQVVELIKEYFAMAVSNAYSDTNDLHEKPPKVNYNDV